MVKVGDEPHFQPRISTLGQQRCAIQGGRRRQQQGAILKERSPTQAVNRISAISHLIPLHRFAFNHLCRHDSSTRW